MPFLLIFSVVLKSDKATALSERLSPRSLTVLVRQLSIQQLLL
jgi:hypothetical protein